MYLLVKADIVLFSYKLGTRLVLKQKKKVELLSDHEHKMFGAIFNGHHLNLARVLNA